MPDLNRALSDGKLAALKLLEEALDDAEDVGRDRWQFAVRKEALLAAGVTVNDLRWLLSCRFVEERFEITRPTDRCRVYRTVPDLVLQDGECFVLSHGGQVYVEARANGCVAPKPESRGAAGRRWRAVGRGAAQGAIDPSSLDAHSSRGEAPRLAWHSSEAELYFRNELVWRRGRKVATLEERLLDGLADADADSWIPNPFGGTLECRQQLKEAVRRLNRKLLRQTLQFHARRDGTQASWEDCP